MTTMQCLLHGRERPLADIADTDAYQEAYQAAGLARSTDR